MNGASKTTVLRDFKNNVWRKENRIFPQRNSICAHLRLSGGNCRDNIIWGRIEVAEGRTLQFSKQHSRAVLARWDEWAHKPARTVTEHKVFLTWCEKIPPAVCNWAKYAVFHSVFPSKISRVLWRSLTKYAEKFFEKIWKNCQKNAWQTILCVV